MTAKSSQLWGMRRLEDFAFAYYMMCNIFHMKILSKHLMSKTLCHSSPYNVYCALQMILRPASTNNVISQNPIC